MFWVAVTGLIQACAASDMARTDTITKKHRWKVVYMVSKRSKSPVSFVDISAVHANFYTAVKSA